MTKALRDVALDDKYRLASGEVYLSGIQALVRLPLVQRRRDLARGLNTAGYVSGYRGSPLGGYDFALWQARKELEAHHIRFEPGLNEDIAATAVWGTQQAAIFGPARYDGVFGVWYGKNPGVDRCGDVFKHANYAGTAPRGGVLAIAGDDPAASSSAIANQSEQAFAAAMIPILYPAGLDEFIDFGLLGFALSRFSGLWTGMKTVSDTIESGGTVMVRDDGPDFVIPNDFELPPGGLHGRWPDDRWSQDARVQNHRLPAALAFIRANAVDRKVFGAARPRFGIVTAGKAYLDVVEALAILGIDQAMAERVGLAVFKLAAIWPLESSRIRAFAEGLDEVVVVEERRAFVESQLKEHAYGWRADQRPRILGKADEAGAPLFPSTGELSGLKVARVLAKRLARSSPEAGERLAAYEKRIAQAAPRLVVPPRMAHFCAGCPHARSTKLPNGAIAMAGIGCHSLAMFDPTTRTLGITQMGGEGGNWIGLAPFVDRPHMFQNMGDGTYFHSGLLSIRAAVAAKTRITYKLLVNDAVAMTGGQPVEGAPDAARITRQLRAEGVGRIALVSDDLGRYPVGTEWAAGTTLHHRDQLIALEKELQGWPGVSVIVYDQVCATEKRRRRKRGQMPQPTVRVAIHPMVCEGCGDCVDKSGCAAVQPLATPFGRKKRIDQSACNVDLSCLRGFCPSFVTIEGGRPRRPAGLAPVDATLPAPPAPRAAPADILVTGVGGTGVITVGALLGMAAHLEGLAATVLDNTGLARKGGAVATHVRIGGGHAVHHTPRIGEGGADIVLGCDLVVTAGPEVLPRIGRGRCRVLLNDHANPTAAQLADPDAPFDRDGLRRTIVDVAGPDRVESLDATTLALSLLGDAIYANVLLLGMAAQRGLLPVSVAALEKAIALNETNAEENRAAFNWGRRLAADPNCAPTSPAEETEVPLDKAIARRAAYLAIYQDTAYAERYGALVARVAAAEAKIGGEAFTRAAAGSYFKLLAIKDEYEVARLLSDPEFHANLARDFEGDYRVAYHLAPPLLASADPTTGEPVKRRYGPWLRGVLRLVAGLKGLRGTAFDIFGRTEERKRERAMILAFEAAIDRLLKRLDKSNRDEAASIVALHERIRGFGPVKERAMSKIEAEVAARLARYEAPVTMAAG